MSSDEVFVGSHEKTFPGKGKGYGQNGDPSASSLMPGKTKPNIAGVSPPTVAVPSGDWQTRDLNVKAAAKEHRVPTHTSMALRGVSDGSPGSGIGSSPARPAKK
jgi:hypothetical protein